MSKSKEQFAIDYANIILSASDKKNAAYEVIGKINNLKYENQELLSDSDKKDIIDKTYDLLLDGRHPRDSRGRRIILNEKENLGYLEVLKAISAKLGEVKGK